MNIYLDIDGVLLIDETHAAPFANEFLQAVLTKYPDTTYWLTTHCWNGENRAKAIISPYLQQQTIDLLDRVKPTIWNEMKTEAINFNKPFLWFDDDLWPEELEALQKHDAEHQFVMVDLAKDPELLNKLIQLP